MRACSVCSAETVTTTRGIAVCDDCKTRTGPKRPFHQNITSLVGERKRTEFLRLVRSGMTRIEAREAIDWAASSLNYHMEAYPDWAAKVRYALSIVQSDRGNNLPIPDDEDFGGFVSRWFPDRQPHKSHQLAIAEQLKNLGPREIRMFLLWPEAGKTATLEDYICWKLAFDPGHRFRYVSEAADLSKRVIGTVQRRFTETHEYGPFIAKYGPFYEKGQERNGRPWTTEQITVLKNESGERDRNLVASSWTSAVYGSRIDTLVLDDLQSQRNYVQAEEIFRRIRGTFFNRGIEMRTLIIGTRIGPGDFYERMLDAGLVTGAPIIMPAQDNATLEPTVPEWWDKQMFHNGGACCSGFRPCPKDGSKLTPREFMELIRHQSGSETWHSSYQQNPQANERTTFAEFLDRCLDHDREYGKLSA